MGGSDTGSQFLERYREDPKGFFLDILGVPEEHYWEAMEQIGRSVVEHPKTCVYAGHGVSKTYTMARLVLWFLYTHPPATVITTAPTNDQVEQLLWRELREAYTAARVDLGGHLTGTKLDLQRETGLRWFALGFATKPDTVTAEATRFQGYHNDNFMLIFDEGAGIHPTIWHAGQHVGGDFKRWVVIGNPVNKSGDFAACKRDPSWHSIHVSVTDTPNFKTGKKIIPGVYGRKYEQDIRLKYGEDSDEYRVRVKGRISRKGAEGSYYGPLMQAAEKAGRVCDLQYNPNYALHRVYDIGYTTAVWMFQVIEQNVFILKYYEDSGPHIAQYIQLFGTWREEEKYHYGLDFVPVDASSNAQKFVVGKTVTEIMREMQCNVKELPLERSVKEGIERSRRVLARCWFDREGTEIGRNRLENYHEAKNQRMSTEDRPVWTGHPEKDGNDHGADAFRYLSMAVEKGGLGSGMTAEEDRELFAKYGGR